MKISLRDLFWICLTLGVAFGWGADHCRILRSAWQEREFWSERSIENEARAGAYSETLRQFGKFELQPTDPSSPDLGHRYTVVQKLQDPVSEKYLTDYGFTKCDKLPGWQYEYSPQAGVVSRIRIHDGRVYVYDNAGGKIADDDPGAVLPGTIKTEGALIRLLGAINQ
jgi:hypothetical protein